MAHANVLCEQFVADTNKFTEQRLRLATIRREIAERAAKNGADDQHDDGGGDDSDMFSDTSSMNSSRLSSAASSRGTAKTHRSSKNRRKHERKLLSLKPGNPFEDIALIDALHTMACGSFDQQLAVRSVARALIDQHFDAVGAALQRIFGRLLETIRNGLDEIWIPEMMVASGNALAAAQNGNVDYAQLLEGQHYAMISK